MLILLGIILIILGFFIIDDGFGDGYNSNDLLSFFGFFMVIIGAIIIKMIMIGIM